MAMEDTRLPHIAILPTPGMGHLIPIAEFAKRLIHHHDFSFTFISIAVDFTTKAQKAVVDALPTGMNPIHLPPVDLSDTPRDSRIETLISLTVRRALPSVRDVLTRLKSTTRLVALVADLFATDAFDVAAEFGIPLYIFFPSNAMALTCLVNLPKLDAMYSCEYRDLPEPVKLPGCIPLQGKDLLDPVQDKKDEAYKWMLHHGNRYSLAKGIILNSFVDMEPGAIKALEEINSPPVHPVGPLIRAGSTGEESECLRWLDEQPIGSVLFVSFGSGGTLSWEQMKELALGLELSEQRFLWVVRSPHEKAANGSYFTVQSSKDPIQFLPTGFLSRTKNVGLVVSSWAPQVQVLSHSSTGGFLCHCGWNSTLETVVHGVPMIAWPLFAEQKMNAVVLSEDLKVALRPREKENGLIGSEEIARVVKGLLEGEEGKRLRSRMRELKDAASRALSEDGSSSRALSELASELKGSKMLT
ncbi:hypothetical protein AAC387_Pa10g0175 [Persea americana]